MNLEQQNIQRQLVEATQAFQAFRVKVDGRLVTKGLRPLSGAMEIDIVRRHWRLATSADKVATHIQIVRELAD